MMKTGRGWSLRRRVVLALVVGVGVTAILIGRPAWHLTLAVLSDVDEWVGPAAGSVDDASRLNETAVAEVWDVPFNHDEPEGQIAALLARARQEGLRVTVAGARHTMGGHTIYPGGLAINMLPWNKMELDEDRNVLTVQAGAVWKDVINYLDPLGRSVRIMQSNNSFSVGGSVSVNCHGWQFGLPPIASSVESFRIMLANGTVRRCSRTENAELFSLALGGYGLFGVILDVDLRVTNNERYLIERYVVPIEQALETFDERVTDRPEVQMVYARMNTAPDAFLEEVIINVCVTDSLSEIKPVSEPGSVTMRRAVFRGSQGNDYGKALRWSAESKLQPWIGGSVATRNQLQNEGVEIFANRSADTTDILHEYFVPRDRVAGFVREMQRIIPEYEVELLNVTVRFVDEDTDTFLRYADQPMFAFVMLFVQDRDEAGEAAMREVTEDLIAAALRHDGCYYLPYRLHATPQQFHEAYPQAERFFELKRKYDPQRLFQNRFYEAYGEANPN